MRRCGPLPEAIINLPLWPAAVSRGEISIEWRPLPSCVGRADQGPPAATGEEQISAGPPGRDGAARDPLLRLEQGSRRRWYGARRGHESPLINGKATRNEGTLVLCTVFCCFLKSYFIYWIRMPQAGEIHMTFLEEKYWNLPHSHLVYYKNLPVSLFGFVPDYRYIN